MRPRHVRGPHRSRHPLMSGEVSPPTARPSLRKGRCTMNQTNKLKVHSKPLAHESTEAESKEAARASQPKTIKKTKEGRFFDPQVFLATIGLKRTIKQYLPVQKII